MKTIELFETTMQVIRNLITNNFSEVFRVYAPFVIEHELDYDIEEYIKFAAANKMPLGVTLAEKAMKIIYSSEFIRADIDRQFPEEDYDDEYGDVLDSPNGYHLSLAENAQELAEAAAIDDDHFDRYYGLR